MKVGVAILLAIAARTAAAQCSDGSMAPCSAPRRPAAPLSIAVLGFRPIGGDRGDSALAEGLAEELTAQLAKVVRLSVTSRAAVRRVRNIEALPLERVGQALNVRFLVQGSVQRAGNRLRIRGELLRAATGEAVWREQYDRSDADVLVVQEAVSLNIVQSVAGQLNASERASLASRLTKNGEAYAAYLRGRTMSSSPNPSPAVYETALRDLRRAVQLDTTFVAAWAWISIAHTGFYWMYFDRTEGRLAEALSAAEHARRLSPNAGVVHFALGNYYYQGLRDYGKALQELTAALAADPGDPKIHATIASIARRQGSFDLSIASRTKALELDPADAGEYLERQTTLQKMRRYQEAEQDGVRALSVDPSALNAHYYRAQVPLMRDGIVGREILESLAVNAQHIVRTTWASASGQAIWRQRGPHQDSILAVATDSNAVNQMALSLAHALVHSSRRDTSRAAAALDTVARLAQERLKARPDDDLPVSMLAQAFAGLGRCEEALAAGQRAVSLLPISRDAFAGPLREEVLAEVEVRCGQPERAIDRLEKLLRIPSNISPQRLRADPAFAPLRGNARFERLIGGP